MERIWSMMKRWKAEALIAALLLPPFAAAALYATGHAIFTSKLWADLGAFGSNSDVLDKARNQPEVLTSVEDYIKLRVPFISRFNYLAQNYGILRQTFQLF